jgi:hypothetical protein
MRLVALCACQLASAQSPQPASLEDLAFMSGCWEGPFSSRGRSGVIEEHYTSPSANLILGTTRYLIDGRTVQFELTVIRADSAGVHLTPYPGGRASDTFRLNDFKDGRAAFEYPEHDYPKRIIYFMDDEDVRVARIDGGPHDTDASKWRMERAACP